MRNFTADFSISELLQSIRSTFIEKHTIEW